MKCSSLQLVLSIASISECPVWSHEVDQAYVQSKEPLQRPIYIRPPKELGLPLDLLWQRLKSLHGVCNSWDHCYETFRNFLTNELNLSYLPSDKSSFKTDTGYKTEILVYWCMIQYHVVMWCS